jgi:hypothetical protein
VFGKSDSGSSPLSQVACDTAIPPPPSLLAPAEGENLRHRCRNPQCRVKLPAPVTNARDAFCCCGCHASFFRTRCRVCEAPIKQPARGTRLICNRAKCKSVWRAGLGLGRYPTPSRAESIREVPVNKGPKVGSSDDRASWLVVAARAPISANQYHCAIVGAAGGIAAADRSNAAHWARSERHAKAADSHNTEPAK